MSALGERSVRIREVEGSNPFRSTKQGIGRTPISSAAVSPCSVRSDPQQESAVLEVIPRRRFLLSAHSLSAISPATMVAERNRRLYKFTFSLTLSAPVQQGQIF